MAIKNTKFEKDGKYKEMQQITRLRNLAKIARQIISSCEIVRQQRSSFCQSAFRYFATKFNPRTLSQSNVCNMVLYLLLSLFCSTVLALGD